MSENSTVYSSLPVYTYRIYNNYVDFRGQEALVRDCDSMAANRWSFTVDQLANTPSRKCGIDSEKESNYRQQAASLIQDMGQRLQVYPFLWCGMDVYRSRWCTAFRFRCKCWAQLADLRDRSIALRCRWIARLRNNRLMAQHGKLRVAKVRVANL